MSESQEVRLVQSSMVGQAGGVAGTSAVIGQAGGIAGTTAGQAGSAASAAVTGQAGGATGAAAKASAHGIAKFLGTVGGKVAVGVVGVAAVVGIGLGIHHASSEPERHIVAIEEEDGNGALMWEDGPAPEVETEQTEEETMPENEDEQQVKSQLEVMLEQARTGMEDYATTGKVSIQIITQLQRTVRKTVFMHWKILTRMEKMSFCLVVGIRRRGW